MILKDLQDLANIRLGNPDLKIAMVNGGFDLFHVSHLSIIKKAKSKADLLVVCVVADEALKNGKGSSRPIVTQEDRAKIVESIKEVDYVFLNKGTGSSDISTWPGYHLKPDLLISGDKRWYMDNPEVEALGIETVLVKRGIVSTTDLIERIRSARD
jgi:cytidyltransferase-like protein